MKRETDLTIVIVSLVTAALGFMAVAAAIFFIKPESPLLAELTTEIGSSLFAIGSLSLAWDLFAKRSFAAEIFEIAKINKDLKDSGILSIGKDYLRDVDWKNEIENSRELQVLFAYGSTWRNTVSNTIADCNIKVTIYLPNPQHADTLNALSQIIPKTPSELKLKIEDAQSQFTTKKIGKKTTVHLVNAIPKYTIYLFDTRGVMIPYPHKDQKSNSPIIICKKGGWLYSFLQEELDSIKTKIAQEPGNPLGTVTTNPEDSKVETLQGH